MNVDGYLAALPADRRAALSAIRDTINTNLPAGYEEGIQYGAISWFVPLSRYPDTYNKQALCLAALASQKRHMALYLMTVYGDPAIARWFVKASAAAGKRLDMGKSCVRFKTADALALDVIGDTIARVSVDRFIASYEKAKPAKKTKASSASRSSRSSRPKRAPARSGSPSSRSRRRS